VVTGAGRAFCTGADIDDTFRKQIDGEIEDDFVSGTAPDWVGLIRKAKLIIAAVNGSSIGVGLTMTLLFDYIMASDRARFCCAFVRMGGVTELASSHFLVQRMGWGRASEFALSARMIEAAEAVQLGLSDRLVPHGELLDEALAVAGTIAKNPSRQLQTVKQLLTQNGTDPT
jgi:2-(1,2-epoxy-1,2-dihydrophenyl)acetyl-CoA isomerase|tara:strand:- start:10533 stop:11048 length:516 start_codon:yes stop_codon:yes gene_type:complete